MYLPRTSEKVDYEAELAVVVGRRAKHVTRERPGHDMATRDLRLLNRKLDEKQKQKPAGGLFGKLFGKRSAR